MSQMMTTPAKHNTMVQAISSLRSPPVVAMAFRCWRENARQLRKTRATLARCVASWRRRSSARAFRTWSRGVFVSRVVSLLHRVLSRWAAAALLASFSQWRRAVANDSLPAGSAAASWPRVTSPPQPPTAMAPTLPRTAVIVPSPPRHITPQAVLPPALPPADSLVGTGDYVRRPNGSRVYLSSQNVMQLRSTLRLLERSVTSSRAAEWMVPAPASMRAAAGAGTSGHADPPPTRKEMERDMAVLTAALQDRAAAGETL
jgi:hypothetical protein